MLRSPAKEESQHTHTSLTGVPGYKVYYSPGGNIHTTGFCSRIPLNGEATNPRSFRTGLIDVRGFVAERLEKISIF